MFWSVHRTTCKRYFRLFYRTSLSDCSIYTSLLLHSLSLASLLDCRAITASAGVSTKAESYIIRIGDLPTRKIRKRVRGFLRNMDVAVVTDDGQTFGVVLEKNQLVIKNWRVLETGIHRDWVSKSLSPPPKEVWCYGIGFSLHRFRSFFSYSKRESGKSQVALGSSSQMLRQG